MGPSPASCPGGPLGPDERSAHSMNEPDHDPIVVSDQEASAHVDLYALTHRDIQDPPATLVKALSQIGPGLILAASIVGTGELINTTALGAKQGFVLLWLIL